MSTPTTPPYLLLLFYVTHALSACVKLVSDIRDSDAIATILLDVIQFIVPSILIWVIGTLPVSDSLPGPSVAASADVRIPCKYTCVQIVKYLRSRRAPSLVLKIESLSGSGAHFPS